MTQFLFALLFAVSLVADAPPAFASQQPPPSQPPQSQTPQTRPGDNRNDFTVGPADVLSVTVLNEPDLTKKFRIDNDGTISFPYLGRIAVAGKTPREIEDQIRKGLLDGILVRPEVFVEVDEYQSRTIFIIGEVREPGKYPLKGDMMLMEVLALAGSVNTEASNEVRILRPKDGSTGGAATPDDSVEQLRVNLDDMKRGILSGNVLLRDGDTVYVPTAERFYISGHIRTPGSFKLAPGMNVQQAIAVAGGLTERGSNRRIKIRRLIGNEQKLIDAKLTDVVLPGDTIIIPQRFI